MTTNIMTASRQWASRPMDERFVSMIDMQEHFHRQRRISKGMALSSRQLEVRPDDDNIGLKVYGPAGVGYDMTNWSFGQLATRAKAPPSYIRTLPAPVSADCLNYGLKFGGEPEDLGVLVSNDGADYRELRAVTGPRYGRIWNSQVIDAMVQNFGDGVTGDFRVPGIFGTKLEHVTKQNTTMYASDRDMFIFLADEEHRIELPNRRNGQPGSLARGFFVWNSEVGSQTFGIAGFLFDYVCANRIVWGAEEYKEIKMRHTVSAPDRFLEEIAPSLTRYSNSSTASVLTAIEDARSHKLDNIEQFLATRFGSRAMKELDAIHVAEEGRPIETRWDVVTAVTAKARDIPYQDQRVELERQAGDLLTT